ncbi:hypothetical protein ABPG75_014018 [Micractinium tetrahymenae]
MQLLGHNPICAGGPSVPASVTADITLEGVAADLAAAKIQALAIDVGALDSTSTNVWDSCPAPVPQLPQASTLAAATGGSYTSGVNPSTIVDTIISAVKEASCPSSSDERSFTSGSTADVMPPPN